MKRTLFLAFVCVITLSYNGFGQQSFRYNYNFQPILNNGTGVLISSADGGKTYQQKQSGLTKLKGIVKKLSDGKDTLSVSLWPITSTTKKGQTQFLNQDDNESKTLIKIVNWPTTNGYKSFDLPFSATELFALTIPLRVNLSDGTVGSEFVNANVAYNWIWGRTRIYESKFVEPRTKYWGVGPFVGMATAKNEIDKDEVGLNYGVNGMFSAYGIKFVVSLGGESTFSRNGKTNPILGFGFGFDLFTITDNSPKQE